MDVGQHSRTDTGGSTQHLIRIALFAGFLYLINQLLLVQSYPQIEFFSAYAGDLLALPVFLPFSLDLAQRLNLVSLNTRIKTAHVLVVTLIFSVIFELILPGLDSRATADVLDCAAYLTGGLLLLSLQRSNSGCIL